MAVDSSWGGSPANYLDRIIASAVNQSKEGPLFCLDEQMIDKAAKALDEIENGRRYRAIPRAYIVFRMLGQLDLLDKLLKQKITDHWFPVGEGGFPSLIEPRLRSAILEFQSLILTKTVHFEKAKHHHFGSADDIWKLFTKNGGKLGYSHIQAGDVFPVTLKVSSEVYALKRLSRNKNAGPDLNIMERLVNELTALKNLTHRHIVQYIGSYTDPASFGLLISPVAEQDLATLLESITSNGTFQGHATELRQYYGCLVGALCYVHSRNIKHKDIKPENILIKGKTVLLTDFGISRAFSTLDGSATIGPTSKDFRYCAREVFTEKTRNRKSDIWSLGCVFLEILSVLKGLSPKKIQTFFNNVGDCELSYHKNIEAVGELLRKFETRDSKLGSEEIDCTWLNPNSTLDNDALYWITRMLRDDPKTRPDAAKVFRWTTTKMAESTPPTTFCGACCFDEGRDIWLTDEESDSQQDQVHSKVTLSSAVYSNYPTSLQSHKTYPRSSLQINESSMVSGYPEPVQSPSGFPFHEVSDTSMYTMQLSVHSYALYTSPDHLKNATINPDASVFGQEGDTTPQRYPSWGIENAKKVDGHASSIAQNAPRKPRHNSRKSYNVRALNSLVLRSSDGVPPAEDELFTKGLRNAIKRTNMPCSIPTTTGYQFYLDHLPFLVSKCGSMLRGKGVSGEKIFITPGCPENVSKLRDIFSHWPDYGRNLWLSADAYSVYDLADVLKMFLQSLTEPLTTLAWPRRGATRVKFPGDDNSELDIEHASRSDKINLYQALIIDLPRANKHLLLYLIYHLSLVAQNQKRTQVTARELAEIFQVPVFLTSDELKNNGKAQIEIDILEFLIDNQHEFNLNIILSRRITKDDTESSSYTTNSSESDTDIGNSSDSDYSARQKLREERLQKDKPFTVKQVTGNHEQDGSDWDSTDKEDLNLCKDSVVYNRFHANGHK